MDLIVKYPNKDTVFIGFFMVDKEHCGQGIGSKIIEDCLKEFKQQSLLCQFILYEGQ